VELLGLFKEKNLQPGDISIINSINKHPSSLKANLMVMGDYITNGAIFKAFCNHLAFFKMRIIVVYP